MWPWWAAWCARIDASFRGWNTLKYTKPFWKFGSEAGRRMIERARGRGADVPPPPPPPVPPLVPPPRLLLLQFSTAREEAQVCLCLLG